MCITKKFENDLYSPKSLQLNTKANSCVSSAIKSELFLFELKIRNPKYIDIFRKQRDRFLRWYTEYYHKIKTNLDVDSAMPNTKKYEL